MDDSFLYWSHTKVCLSQLMKTKMLGILMGPGWPLVSLTTYSRYILVFLEAMRMGNIQRGLERLHN